jgi:hypothetical protein
VNSELRMEKLGCGLAGHGMCAIIHIWRLHDEPQT